MALAIGGLLLILNKQYNFGQNNFPHVCWRPQMESSVRPTRTTRAIASIHRVNGPTVKDNQQTLDNRQGDREPWPCWNLVGNMLILAARHENHKHRETQMSFGRRHHSHAVNLLGPKMPHVSPTKWANSSRSTASCPPAASKAATAAAVIMM